MAICYQHEEHPFSLHTEHSTYQMKLIPVGNEPGDCLRMGFD